MLRFARSVALLSLALVAGCQKNDQAPVQPEKLATSSASSDAAAPPSASASVAATSSAPGPLIPYAAGQGPAPTGDIPSPDGAEPLPSPDAAPSGKTAAAAPPQGAKAVPTVAKTPVGKVTLVKAGAEPRTELRFVPKVGQIDALSMTMKVGMGVSVGTKKMPPGNVPPMLMKLSLKVGEVRPNGDIRYDFMLNDTEVNAKGIDPKIAKALDKGLGALVGLGGYAIASSTGITREVKVNPPKGASPQMQQIMQGMEQAMNQILMPLPDEPVGKGAQWTFTNTVRQNGVLITQVSTFDLVGVKPGKIKLDVKLEQKAKPQTIVAPNGARVKLVGLSAAGTGKSILRLAHISPQRSSLAISTQTKMTLPDKRMMAIDTNMSIDMSGK